MSYPLPPQGPAPQDPYAHQGPTGPAPDGDPAPHGPGSPYGAPAPYPPARPTPGSELGADLGAALRFAGRALLRSPLALLGAGALYLLLMVVVILAATALAVLLVIAAIGSSPTAGGELTAAQTLLVFAVSIGVVLVALPVAVLWQSGAARAGGVLLEGGRPGFGQGMIGPGRVILTAVLVLVLITIGSLLLYLPGLIASVLLMYAIPASLRGASPGAALKESFSLARAHLGTTVVGFLVVTAASYVGGLVVIGIIASIPFTVLFQLALYERLSGREVPELAET